mmetsp:Transcript_27189/g.43167  ORF Transcript_27189/g.43167 Transcript_27189/m.43167 type:complete len:92 (-) Transcript_27189:78-353(-)
MPAIYFQFLHNSGTLHHRDPTSHGDHISVIHRNHSTPLNLHSLLQAGRRQPPTVMYYHCHLIQPHPLHPMHSPRPCTKLSTTINSALLPLP